MSMDSSFEGDEDAVFISYTHVDNQPIGPDVAAADRIDGDRAPRVSVLRGCRHEVRAGVHEALVDANCPPATSMSSHLSASSSLRAMIA